MIYLDNASTTYPKPECVKSALLTALDRFGANAGRAGFEMAVNTGRMIFETRLKVAKLLGLNKSQNVAFTHNATHSLNLAINGVVKNNDIIVTSGFEHNAVKRVLNHLKNTKNISVRILKTDKFGHFIDVCDTLKGANLLVLMHANNVSGTIFPINEIFKIAKENGVITILDAAQSIGIVPFDMKFTDIACAGGHKGLFGIQGTGIIALSDDFEIGQISPFMQGGTGSKSQLEIQPNFMPDMLESGTQNAHGICTIGAGIDFINENGIDKIFSHEKSMKKFLIAEISKLKSFQILQTPPNYDTNGNLSIICQNFSPSDLANRLASNDICVRASLHCNPSTHKFYGTFPNGAVRISPGFFNTQNELEKVIEILKDLA